jgi:predicted SAM-dependent methyltransferase
MVRRMAAADNIPQRVGGWLQGYPPLYGAVARGVQGVGLLRRKRQIESYLGSHTQRFLRLGSGSHVDSGWLSADLLPVTPAVVYINATKEFPLPADSFDAVQCEHMIEHISYESGLVMLREIRRVLRPNGVLRIATPNVDLVRRLLDGPSDDPALARYVEWSNRSFGNSEEDVENPVFTVNRMVRNWGHTFLYDEATLRHALELAGFRDIVRVTPHQSEHAFFQGMDRHQTEVGDEQNLLETLALEGTA